MYIYHNKKLIKQDNINLSSIKAIITRIAIKEKYSKTNPIQDEIAVINDVSIDTPCFKIFIQQTAFDNSVFYLSEEFTNVADAIIYLQQIGYKVYDDNTFIEPIT